MVGGSSGGGGVCGRERKRDGERERDRESLQQHDLTSATTLPCLIGSLKLNRGPLAHTNTYTQAGEFPIQTGAIL